MTENQIKEAISEAFIRLILAYDGFKIYKAEYDHGIDLQVCAVEKMKLPNGKFTYRDSDRRLDIQLKCTTKKSVEFKENFVEYNLRNKNYQELKDRVDSPYIKMMLVVLILPDDENLWLDVLEDSVLLRKHCFYYVPSDKTIPPEILVKGMDFKVKIEIPIKNHLLKNFKLIFNQINGI